MAMDIKVQPRPVNGEGDLALGLEKIFTEEWGGPKSALALAYLRDTVIPDLIYCLKKNWHFLDNPSFREILTAKLNTQFAYPPAFAEGLAGDILACAKGVLGVSPVANNHPWQPWEIILRMFTIGYRLPEIVRKTGYPEAYLDVFRKKYLKLQEIAEGLGNASEEQLLAHRELAGAGVHLIRFVADFRNRFTVFKNYYERLQAEQIIMDMELELDPDCLIKLFEGLFQVEKQLSPARFADILKGAKTAWLTGESYYTKTAGYGLLADWPRKQITTLLDRLLASNLIIHDTGHDSVLSLSEQAARLIVPLVVPALADEVQAIMRSKARDKISRSTAVLLGKNPEITVHVIRELVRRGDPAVVLCFKALQRRVPKKVFLQIVWACGQLGGKDAVNLLSKTILDRDSLVRVRTCQAMGHMADPSFYFALINALEDPVAMVREQAALALGRLKMPSALKHMERILENPAEEPQVQRAARETKTVLLKEKELRESE
ncbi:RQC domain-containing protein [Desulforamulus putei DSM 12395]|uniref:RQC domain-containing protein n=2 Tax=Desulforamulus putei TaxID=74701 RepID=A0A1M4SYM7_9FIRM|nr:RQC domain-containing protein [Desulforamulus putei DSM 12395]